MSDSPEKLLAEPSVCVLATVGRDGQAHAMPMWHLYEDGKLIFMTGRRAQKCRNIERTGTATVVCDRRSPPYYAVMVQGKASIGPALDADARRRMVERYLSPEAAERYLEQLAATVADAVSIVVEPTRIVEFNGSAGR